MSASPCVYGMGCGCLDIFEFRAPILYAPLFLWIFVKKIQRWSITEGFVLDSFYSYTRFKYDAAIDEIGYINQQVRE